MSSVPADRSAQRRTFGSACLAHALHDGLIDGLLILLPVFQTQFALTYGAVGLLRATATGVMATAQIPAARLADRVGARVMLVAGTTVAATGYAIAGLSNGLLTVFAGLALVGLGASVQHPIASELIASVYAQARRRMALGVYNFTGDLGKVLVPPLAALLLTWIDWRLVCFAICGTALVTAIVLTFTLAGDVISPERALADADDAGPPPPLTAFRVLLAIGVLDSATRMAFLTFLPFLLTSKGGSLEAIGLALSLIFVGGAAGKFVCAWLSVRIGPIATVIASETLTAAMIVAVALLPLGAALVCLPLLGVALNGTSSVLYGSVAELVPERFRRRAFAIFYTGTVGSGAVAPVVAGLFIDRVGLVPTLGGTACLALAVIPLAIVLRPSLQAPLSGASTSPSR